ncbi:amidohydrolase, partial [Streptomyces sp. NPDC127044]
MHMHPELGNQEFRTTAALKARLEQAGLKPRVLDIGTGLICDIGIDAGEGAGEGEAGGARDRARDRGVDGGRGMLALRAALAARPRPQPH